ncbi:MAG: hypothetical protein BWX83_01296 [Candidatus Cloacimonetes bacterium ADurb.Bin117]|nr:MAG: hypothetical protein BWX83_01296 [Candidatus Cloacimonetes bacterium ADurb.Bin117]
MESGGKAELVVEVQIDYRFLESHRLVEILRIIDVDGGIGPVHSALVIVEVALKIVAADIAVQTVAAGSDGRHVGLVGLHLHVDAQVFHHGAGILHPQSVAAKVHRAPVRVVIARDDHGCPIRRGNIRQGDQNRGLRRVDEVNEEFQPAARHMTIGNGHRSGGVGKGKGDFRINSGLEVQIFLGTVRVEGNHAEFRGGGLSSRGDGEDVIGPHHNVHAVHQFGNKETLVKQRKRQVHVPTRQPRFHIDVTGAQK